jgi:hypothetical protein
MEQLVARWAHNPKAVGSSPAPATTKLWHLCRGFFYVQFFDELFALKVWSGLIKIVILTIHAAWNPR